MALKDPEGTFKWSKMQKSVEVIGIERTNRQKKVLPKFFMEIIRSSSEVPQFHVRLVIYIVFGSVYSVVVQMRYLFSAYPP